jgi:predicted flap endonuclease-1-like 5' DNA nuclease
MIWVLLEILVPLLLALGVGVFIGWLVFRWRRRLIHASEWNRLAKNAQEAEIRAATERAAYEEANNERTMLSSRVTTLTADLDSTRTKFEEANESKEALILELDALREEASAARAESKLELARLRSTSASLEAAIEERDAELARTLDDLNTARQRSEQQQDELDALNAELSVAHAKISATSARLEEVESGAAASALVSARVEGAEARASELEAALIAARSELDVSQGRIADFDARLATSHVDITAAHERIGQLEAQLHEHEDGEAVVNAFTSPVETPFGTAAADHVDDLKVIRGIGPRMEELLTSLGITSWEQLAALDSEGVAAVDNALGEFPGRIERDEWVAQAQELVRQFPDVEQRPRRDTFLNRTEDDDPFS